jgi:predicted DNA-binding transcriptional regulator YafY
MLDTSARLLALLSLMQSRPAWPGSELAERLDVSPRTIRNEVERLRTLGYPVDAVRGAAGHYRLGAGAKLPPLLLDDEEAVAVAIGLQSSAAVAGIEESSARALAKLEQVLPHRLRRKVTALHSTVVHVTEDTGTNVQAPDVDPEVLSTIAAAVRDHERIRFGYRTSEHLVEPYRLVSWRRRWYLVAKGTDGWTAFRVDWMALRMRTGLRFPPDPLPGGDYTSFVLREVSATGWIVHARITVFASADEVVARINSAVGVVESVDENTSVLVTGGDSYEIVAVYIGMLGLDFHVGGPPDLVAHLADLGRRYTRAVGGAHPSTPEGR